MTEKDTKEEVKTPRGNTLKRLRTKTPPIRFAQRSRNADKVLVKTYQWIKMLDLK